MLPSRPNALAAGLPSGPRSRSVGRSRQYTGSIQYDSERPASSRQLRSQKSVASFSRESLRSGPPPSSSRSPGPSYHNYSRSYDTRPEPHKSRRSEDSVTSSGSSLFERMKNGAASYASSFTSVDDEDDYFKAEDNARGRSLRSRGIAKSEPSSPQDREDVTDTGTGDGTTIWSRVATAASTLTVSVSKAWASNITTFAGEETPPGQESRLTRAMKAYHIEKSHDPSDLPSWLFDEHERQPRARTGPLRDREVEQAPEQTPRSRRARGVHDPNVSTNAMSARPDQSSHRTPDFSGPPPKGADRLKALREARRNAAQTSENERTSSTLHDRQRIPRVGLPSGPVARNRLG